MKQNEIRKKEQRVHAFLENNGLDGVLLSQRDSFAWITCGGFSGVDKSVQGGAADILFLDGKKYLFASEVERYRFMEEELAGQGYELIAYPWVDDKKDAILPVIKGKRISSDSGMLGTPNIYSEFRKIRYSLLEEEVERLNEVAELTADSMKEICSGIRPGDSEYEIAAGVTGKVMKQGAQLPVCLIAADDRIKKYRHPIPTENRVKDYAMVVLCVEKYGLVVSATRLVSFSKPNEDLVRRHKACMTVDANLINNTDVGASVKDIFAAAVRAYEECGYPEEWMKHHQGGAAGYSARDYVATFETDEKVVENQVYAWNPSIAGTKTEDTILATAKGQSILTGITGWPMCEIEINGRKILRPDIWYK